MRHQSISPVDAYGELHDCLIRIEALAGAAFHALNEVKIPPQVDRVHFERLYALMSLLAREATSSLEAANEQLREFGKAQRR